MAKKTTRPKTATKLKRTRGSANAEIGGIAAAERAVIVTGKTGDINTGTQIVIKGNDPASRALRIYLDALRNACTQLPIAAMGGREETRKDVTLDQVYIALDTTQPAPKGKGARAKAELALGRDEKRLPALDAVMAHRTVALLGGPGSGKSSFVNQLAADIAAARIKKPHQLKHAPAELLARVPLKIVLRELAERLAQAELSEKSAPDELLRAVWAHWGETLQRMGGAKAEDKLRRMLDDGHGLLIFDGLDEVAHEARLVIRKAVGAVIARYPAARVIVTCRTLSYPDVRFEGFEEFTLGKLNEAQIKAFVQAWYGAHAALGRMKDDEARRFAADLSTAAIGPYRGIAEQSPLLLTVMAIVHRQGTKLPTEEVQLYDLAVKVLDSRWVEEKQLKLHADVERLLDDPRRLDELIQEIAYAQHSLQGREKNPQALLPRAAVIDLLERPDLLGPDFNINAFLNFVDQVSGILLGHGGSGDPRDKRPLAYGFPHRTFQEYLAGRRMMWGGLKARKKLLLEHAEAGDYWTNAARYGWESLKYLGSTRNDDLLELAQELSRLEPRTPTTWRAQLWAGRMAALEGAERVRAFAEADGDPDLLSGRLIPRLLKLTTEMILPAIERAAAGSALAALGDPRFGAQRYGLPVTDDFGFIALPAGSVQMGTHKDDFERVMAVIGADSDAAKNWRETYAGHEINPSDAPTLVPAGYMARYPTTVGQWRAYVEASGAVERYARALADPDNQPVRFVTFYDALGYCEWLNQRLIDDDATPAALRAALRAGHLHVTLPSEAEWEYAARGPADSADNPRRVFPWPEDCFDAERANAFETKIERPTAVGAFPDGASACGCNDMAGNVWEWTRSLWGADFQKPEFVYPYDTRRDAREALDADRSVLRIVRGGAFNYYQFSARVAYRDWNGPLSSNFNLGFRVSVSPLPFDGPLASKERKGTSVDRSSARTRKKARAHNP